MTADKIKRVASAIRNEIGALLSDYAGDQQQLIEEGETAEIRLAAHGRLVALQWLEDKWTETAAASEERLEGVAAAAIKAAAE